MATMRERNDRKSGKKQGPKQRPEGQRERGWSPKPDSDSRPREPRRIDADHLIWGRHAVLAALDDQGLRSNTMVVVVADHGEEFGDRGGMIHGPAATRRDTSAGPVDNEGEPRWQLRLLC